MIVGVVLCVCYACAPVLHSSDCPFTSAPNPNLLQTVLLCTCLFLCVIPAYPAQFKLSIHECPNLSPWRNSQQEGSSSLILLFVPSVFPWRTLQFKLWFQRVPEPRTHGGAPSAPAGHHRAPVSGVNVTAVADSASLAAGFQAGGESWSGGESREGEYLVGPLSRDPTYHVELQKVSVLYFSVTVTKHRTTHRKCSSVHSNSGSIQ